MSDNMVSKERLSAYQRWELNSFDPKAAARPAAPSATELQAAHDKVRHINQQAYQEGYAAGFQEGSARAHAEALRMAALVSGLERELGACDQKVAEGLLGCALALAKQMTRQALRVHPEMLLAVVREVIAVLPPFNQHARLLLNPADAQLVRTHLGEQLASAGFSLLEDAALAPGGCRVQSASCEVDATMETRWRRIVAALGQNDEWLQ
jgi:flagellar assembly protein FliH